MLSSDTVPTSARTAPVGLAWDPMQCAPQSSLDDAAPLPTGNGVVGPAECRIVGIVVQGPPPSKLPKR
jgi:hypothetical protein